MTYYQILTIVFGALMSFGFGLLAFSIHRAERKREARELTRDEHMCLIIGLSMASLELSDAVAISMKNGKCNGEIEAARLKANKVKCDYRDFITKQGIHSL